MRCDRCNDKQCYEGKDCRGDGGGSLELYSGINAEIHRVATLIEGRYYMQKTRMEELRLFCREMGYRRLGIAFCLGLEHEAAALCSYLRQEFTVFSVCCKVCGLAKEKMNLEKIKPERYEAMCNPIVQARVLEEKGTELNITVGLCIGHDILFNSHSAVVSTAFLVKDRVLAHNPAGALYSRYYKKLFNLFSQVDEAPAD